MRKTLVALMVTGAAMLGLAAPASAQGVTGRQHFTIVLSGNGNKGTVTASGPISGSGKDTEVSNSLGIFRFSGGSVRINHTDTSETDHFNEAACVGTFNGTGTYQIAGGTGAYRGATGSGTYKFRGTFIGTKTAHGCSDRGGTTLVVVTTTGTTTLP